MPIGLNVDNPQSQVSEPVTSTATGAITFGGNVLGGGSASTSASSGFSFSTILLYGAAALILIYILKKIGN